MKSDDFDQTDARGPGTTRRRVTAAVAADRPDSFEWFGKPPGRSLDRRPDRGGAA